MLDEPIRPAAEPKAAARGLRNATNETRSVTIKAPNFKTAAIGIKGTAPYVQNAFSAKARNMMIATQEAGQQAKSRRKREPKDFETLFREATHRAAKGGWYGIPASAFRNAAISACRVAGFKMTVAKLTIFIEADGFDAADGTPLVRLIAPDPEMSVLPCANATGVIDMRPRPMWREWAAKVRVRWDDDQFSAADVVNLFARIGLQVGIGEGRPDSKNSNGMGWGHFIVEQS